MSQTPIVDETAPPTLGQHSEELLRSIGGLSDDQIARLRAAGVI
jgi:crotonobetainyl-CoA:carnitine CoA-transferase CaiB-like acyl-CoA transferase